MRLWLSVIPTFSGRLALPNRIRNWSLTSFEQRLVKTGGRLVKHARYYWLLLAKGHLNRRLVRQHGEDHSRRCRSRGRVSRGQK